MTLKEKTLLIFYLQLYGLAFALGWECRSYMVQGCRLLGNVVWSKDGCNELTKLILFYCLTTSWSLFYCAFARVPNLHHKFGSHLV